MSHREFASSLLSAISGYNEKMIIYKSGSRPHWTANVPELWSWTSQPLEITICCLSHLVYDNLLQQPEHARHHTLSSGTSCQLYFPFDGLIFKILRNGPTSYVPIDMIWRPEERLYFLYYCTHNPWAGPYTCWSTWLRCGPVPEPITIARKTECIDWLNYIMWCTLELGWIHCLKAHWLRIEAHLSQKDIYAGHKSHTISL